MTEKQMECIAGWIERFGPDTSKWPEMTATIHSDGRAWWTAYDGTIHCIKVQTEAELLAKLSKKE